MPAERFDLPAAGINRFTWFQAIRDRETRSGCRACSSAASGCGRRRAPTTSASTSRGRGRLLARLVLRLLRVDGARVIRRADGLGLARPALAGVDREDRNRVVEGKWGDDRVDFGGS